MKIAFTNRSWPLVLSVHDLLHKAGIKTEASRLGGLTGIRPYCVLVAAGDYKTARAVLKSEGITR